MSQLGRVRVDAYAWMKYIPEEGMRTMETLPAILREHLKAEMHYADQLLHPLESDIRSIYERMLARVPEPPALPALPSQGWQYESTVSKTHGHRVFSRNRADGYAEILLDESLRAREHAYYRATGHQASPDHRYFAWAEDIRGDDRHQICVLNIERGTVQIVARADAFGYGGFAFSASGNHIFWIWLDECSRPRRLYCSPVQGGPPELLHEEADPAMFMKLTRTAAGNYLALNIFGPDTSEVFLLEAHAETASLRLVRARQTGIRYEVDEWNGGLLLLTNEGNAPDRQLLALDPHDFSVRGTLVPPRQGRSIVSVHPYAKALLRIERQDGELKLVSRSPDGNETPLQFNEVACMIEVLPQQPYDAETVRIVVQSPAMPRRWLDVCLASGKHCLAAQEQPGDFHADDYVVERLYARADDGATIPITLLSRRDAGDTPLPVLLTGYGAYGISYETTFSVPATVLVDLGFRYAIAHVRGGSEKGWHWYQDGCRENKRNSMTDFIACANALVDQGHARRGEIVSYGVSAGGLLVAGAMNMAPCLWAGVIAQVPFVDMLNTMSDADHPLVPLLRPDWGDPLSDPAAYDAILAISPYENVRAADYPPLLCTAGLKDDRVPYWEPAKLVANVRHFSTSGHPAVLQLNPESGHQESDALTTEFAQAALFWAFARRCINAIQGRSSETG